MRSRAHIGFGLVLAAAALGGGLLWSEWGAVALLNGYATICG